MCKNVKAGLFVINYEMNTYTRELQACKVAGIFVISMSSQINYGSFERGIP